MDFNLDETQRDLRTLTAELLAREDGQDAARLWDALREAGLTAICVPEHAGGAGLGPVEMAVVLRELGARAAPGPLRETLVSTLAVSRHGSPGQQRRLSGETPASVAIREPGRPLTAPPVTIAERAPADLAAGWFLTGSKSGVTHPGGDVLVTADQGLFLVHAPPAAPEFTSTGEPAATITLERCPAERVGGPEAAGDVRRLFTAAVTAQASGVLAGALELTTAHIRTRKQFGRALAEFQAVTMQIADVYITGRALDVAMWSGAWRLDAGLPAEEDLAVAALHADEAARALYTCQHLHGGLGLDVTYPLHRYFAQAKHLTHLLGGADAQLDLIGGLA
ncbi:acyl-CoA dehydrogenase family protein [Nonomuraea sp. NPDC003214]